MDITYGYLYELWYTANLKVPIKNSVSSHCHTLLTGASGSGKSYTLLFILGKTLQACPATIIYFCDFKNSEDFRFLKGYRYYYAGDECYSGVMQYYESFTDARLKGYSNKRYLLICDEYPAFITYLQTKDKANKTKNASDILAVISELLMLGRGLSYGVLITCQRADSSWFSSGSRDNFMINICLGNPSKEQKGMLFPGEDLPQERIYKRGEGLISMDGSRIQEIKIPCITDTNKWKANISRILVGNPGALPREDKPSTEQGIEDREVCGKAASETDEDTAGPP